MRQRGSGNTNCSSLSYAGALVAELRVACPELVSGIRSVGSIACAITPAGPGSSASFMTAFCLPYRFAA
jgi:hypothetical protein